MSIKDYAKQFNDRERICDKALTRLSAENLSPSDNEYLTFLSSGGKRFERLSYELGWPHDDAANFGNALITAAIFDRNAVIREHPDRCLVATMLFGFRNFRNSLTDTAFDSQRVLDFLKGVVVRAAATNRRSECFESEYKLVKIYEEECSAIEKHYYENQQEN